MVKFFNYNNQTGSLELNKEEILLLKEFNDLMESERNKCPEDPAGRFKLRAFREFKYIYLMLDWQSPICDFSEQNRNKEARRQASIADEEFSDPLFRTACRKYEELRDSFRTYKLLKSVYTVIDKLTIYFNDLVDLSDVNDGTGQLRYKAKDVIAEAKGIGPLLDEVRAAEERYKKDIEKQSKIKGDYEPGYRD